MGVGIVGVVCDKICGKDCGKISGKICGKNICIPDLKQRGHQGWEKKKKNLAV